MNLRIKQLAEQCWDKRPEGQLHFDNEKFAELIVQECCEDGHMGWHEQFNQKFAELIVQECCEVAHCNFHVDGLTLGGIMKEHFGIEEYSAQPDDEAAAFIAAEDKKVASKYGYFPKLHPSEWKDK
jgi:hypothetical protein